MLDRERYLFDLNGYLVLKSILTRAELDALRTEVRRAGIEDALCATKYLHAGFPRDYYDTGEWVGPDGYSYSSESFVLDWGPAARSLVAHPRLLGHLAALLGPDFRLDHAYGIFSRGRTRSHPLHNGGTPFDATQMYLCRDGRMYNSMVVVQFALTETRLGDGGFCCIPGSHKANFPLPTDMPQLEDLDDEWSIYVRHIPMAPGDVLIFTEAVTHGALGWRGKDDRMTLLYKYCHGALQWEKDSPFVSGNHSWSPVEHRVMTGPYAGGREPVVPKEEN
ncbi:MAG TPA: phytanoyl-CoA dioxygenase family protein [Streptosporangiaceae bacterium]|nr:phytanoyl-CoA dioxygenase family protein [Streptosporangiaceae bacterium]